MNPALNWMRALTADEQLVIDLVADERLRLNQTYVDGLVVRRALAGGERRAKEQLLENLVPVFLRRGGSDSFMLMPHGALRSKYSGSVRHAAGRVREFIQQLFREDHRFQQFTWETLSTRAFPEGVDRSLVEWVLVCLGTIGGGSAGVWPRPHTDVLESVLDEELTLEEVLTCGQRLMIQWTIDTATLDKSELPPKYFELLGYDVSGTMIDPEGEDTRRLERARTSVRQIVHKFHAVSRQLTVRHGGRPTLTIQDEYDAQDLLHTLLRVFFNDVRREEPTPSHAGQAARIDFLLKDYGIGIEVKMARARLGARELGGELLQDIARYQRHTDCKWLMCFIYDPHGMVQNPTGLESDLSRRHEDLEVEVLVVPS